MGWELELVGAATSLVSFPLARQLLIDYTALGSYFLLPFYFLILHRFEEKNAAYLTALTGAITGITVFLLKNVFTRARPSAALIETGGHSFPSGHAALVFSLAVVFSDRWPGRKIMFYSLAAAVSITRVFLGVHYPTDILAGGILGFLVGKLCSKHLPELLRNLPD